MSAEQIAMFGCTSADLVLLLAEQEARGTRPLQVLASMLSDAQELATRSHVPTYAEELRQLLNRAKWIALDQDEATR